MGPPPETPEPGWLQSGAQLVSPGWKSLSEPGQKFPACHSLTKAESGLEDGLYFSILRLMGKYRAHSLSPPHPLQCPTSESHLLSLVHRPLVIQSCVCCCILVCSLFLMYGESLGAGQCQLPLYPKSFVTQYL